MSWGAQWKPVIAMVVMNFAFAIVNVLLKKIIDEGTSHMVIVTYRLSMSTVFLAPIAYFWERKSRPKLTVSILCYLFFGALIGLTLTQYTFLIGLDYTSATFSCAFLNTVPVNTFILALLFRQEKLNLQSKAGRAKLLGAVICMSGAILLTLYKGIPLTNQHYSRTDTSNHGNTDEGMKKTQRWLIGSLLLMAGCLMWSSWFLIQARISKQFPCQYSSTTILTFFSAIQSAVLCLIIERNFRMWVLKGKLEIIAIAYSGIVGSGLCYVGLSWFVKQKGPVFTAAFTPFTQMFAAMFDFSFLHEQLYLGSVLGSVLVILGLYILLWGKSKEAGACTLKQLQPDKEEQTRDAESQVSATINLSSQ